MGLARRLSGPTPDGKAGPFTCRMGWGRYTARMIFPTLILAAMASAQSPALNVQQSATLRCSAAFAIVAQGQANGNTAAQAYPPLAERGREFFVRTAARLMDELQLDRAEISALVSREAQQLWDEEGLLEQVMPSCLALLEASGV